jgi:hypothetical protein
MNRYEQVKYTGQNHGAHAAIHYVPNRLVIALNTRKVIIKEIQIKQFEINHDLKKSTKTLKKLLNYEITLFLPFFPSEFKKNHLLSDIERVQEIFW